MLNERDYWTVEAMEEYGGSFVRALGRAAEVADTNNLIRIKRHFPEFWQAAEKKGIIMEKKAKGKK